jgi:hypothetical protein
MLWLLLHPSTPGHQLPQDLIALLLLDFFSA